MAAVKSGLAPSLMHRLRRLPPQARDVGLAAAVTLLDLKVFSADLVLEPTVLAYAAVGAVALAFRRRAPFAVFIVVCLQSLIGLFLFPYYGALVGLLLALYTVAAHCSTATARLALVVVFGAAVVYSAQASYFTQPGAGPADVPAHHGFVALLVLLVFYGLFMGPAWAAGRWIQERRLRMEADEAVMAERVRISRELHDIIAHSVTLMMLEAAVARRTMTNNPSQAGQALADVDEQGQQAMSELRRMLAVLRANGLEGPESNMGASHGLADVETLVAAVRRAGVVVDLVSPPEHPRLDPSVELTVYRVVQEGLTNVTKHAGPGSHAIVQLVWTADGDLVVQVRDDGRGKTEHATRTLVDRQRTARHS